MVFIPGDLDCFEGASDVMNAEIESVIVILVCNQDGESDRFWDRSWRSGFESVEERLKNHCASLYI